MSRFDKGAIMLLACGSIGNLVNAVVSRPFEVESAKACQRRPSAVDLLSSSDLRRLQREGMCTVSLGKYIGKENMKQVKAHALSLVKEGQLKASGNSMEVRQDTVMWVEGKVRPEATSAEGSRSPDIAATNEEEAKARRSSADEAAKRNRDRTSFDECLAMMRGLGSELDMSQEYTRSSHHTVPTQMQLACYDGASAAYRAHRDNAIGPSSSVWYLGLVGYFQSRMYRQRCVTAILYLNDEEWDTREHGGALRLYMGADSDDEVGATASQVIDVAPAGGTLVVFDSRVVLHEVMPTFSRRLALTLWISGDFHDDAA